MTAAQLNRKAKRWILMLGMLVILAALMFPLVWIVSTSLKSLEEFRSAGVLALPLKPTLDNYKTILVKSSIALYYKNTTIVALASLLSIGVLGSMSGFALGIMRFRFRSIALTLFLSGIMVPITMTLIPLFMIYKSLHLIDTYLALIVPYTAFGLPMAIYMFIGFYRYIPGEIFESAVMDGASIYRVFLRIVVPLSKNTFITVLTTNLIFAWNEYVFATTFLSKPTMKTLTLGLNDYVGQYGLTDWGATFAAITVSVLPIFVVYFVLNKKVISAMTAGAVKG